MTKAFIRRVKREGIVDTRRYRYVYHVIDNTYGISRIDIDLLDTTAALDKSNWKVVYREKH